MLSCDEKSLVVQANWHIFKARDADGMKRGV